MAAWFASLELPAAVTVALSLGLVLLSVIHRYLTTPRNLPPGPTGLPLLGYLPFMSHDWHYDFWRLGKKYGDIFSMYYGTTLVIVLNKFPAIQEALIKKPMAFAGRPYSHGFELMGSDPENLFKDDFTPKFKERKKFAVAGIRGMGIPNFNFGDSVNEHIQYGLDFIRRYKGNPFCTTEPVNGSVMNFVANLYLSITFDLGSKESDNFISWTQDWFTAMGPLCEADTFPMLRFSPFRQKLVQKGRHGAKMLNDFFLEKIEEHRKTFDTDSPRDFVDLCLKKGFDNDEILLYLFSLWGDAVDTTSGGIRWWILYMSKHPECQAKAQWEVDDNIGSERLPRLDDRSKMNYLEASFMEATRIATPLAGSLALRTTDDSVIQGYNIPKNTVFHANWMGPHWDPMVWGDPEVFRPERFLDNDGELVQNQAWMPFAVGKRSCMGKPMARDITFLVLANLMQNFTFYFAEPQPEGETPFDVRRRYAVTGVTNVPDDFKCTVIDRKTV